jgi:arginase
MIKTPENSTEIPHMKRIQMIGLPTDKNSSFLKGAAKAPAKIRELLGSDMMNLSSETGLELGRDIAFKDRGDLDFHAQDEQSAIQACVTKVLETDQIPLLLGGDHSVTYPIVKAIAAYHGKVNILHIDAHPDLYEDYQGNRCSHASPFARIMEDHLVHRLVQVGIRTLNQHQKEQADRFGIEIITMEELADLKSLQFNGPLYISIDLDGLDPAYAPGVSHHEPGGLTVRQLLHLLSTIRVPIVGADVVEYNPDRDINDMTAAVAVKLVKELAALAASQE